MENQPLDFEQQAVGPVYVKFWPRLGAYLLDILIVGLPLIAVSLANQMLLKSAAVLVVLTLVQLGYRPIMEALYGATPGKMILKQKVVARDLGKLDWGSAMIRNVFGIVFGLATLYFSIEIYSDPDFQAANGWMESSQALANAQKNGSSVASTLNYVYMGLIIIEIIVLALDKMGQSLHDKIASTFVIKR